MRDPARIDSVLAAVRAYWVQNPDLRLGQLIHHAAANTPAVYDIADDVLAARLRADTGPNETAEAEFRDLLVVLDARGGLGSDVHNSIRASLTRHPVKS